MLTVNAGSSSLRLASHSLEVPAERLADERLSPAPAADSAVIIDFLDRKGLPRPELVMHRVVHGGHALPSPSMLDERALAEIRRLAEFAPLHNDLALDWIDAARNAFGPHIPQAACFDTGFYAALPEHAARYALPRSLADRYGIRRYGFHGLAHQSMLEHWRSRSETADDRRVISLQLGSGCSITASENGSPVETSMGFSPLEGLMMATRSGNLDPAAVLHLVAHAGMGASELDDLLNRRSGLLGVSGESDNMKVLLESGSDPAQLAVAMFCHRTSQYVGAYLGVLRGARAILFGGGIGEHSPVIRRRVLGPFGWADIRLDEDLNQAVDPRKGGPIHAPESRVEIWVTPTDEARVMAAAARKLWLSANSGGRPTPTETAK